MAKLMLIGDVAQVEILTDPADEELVLARCTAHYGVPDSCPPWCGVGGPKCARSVHSEGVISEYAPCAWRERYDTQGDAINYAEDHADKGRG